MCEAQEIGPWSSCLLAKMWDPTWKITKAERPGYVVQVVECLPNKSKALSSSASTTKKQRREEKEG
jgi:hypothetical protein